MEAAASHTKSHGIHVDMVLLGGTIANIVVLGPLVEIIVDRRIFERPLSFLVSENRNVDFDLPTPPPANVRCQGRKANVRISNLIGYVLGS